jgi:hypothetical protein
LQGILQAIRQAFAALPANACPIAAPGSFARLIPVPPGRSVEHGFRDGILRQE